jgi:asparaginyl-tRNA synthetase
LQVVVDFENFDEETIKKINTASSLKVVGEVVESQGAGQTVEIIAKKITVLGDNFFEELQKPFFNLRNTVWKNCVNKRI